MMSMFIKPHDFLHPFLSSLIYFCSNFFPRLLSSTSTSFLLCRLPIPVYILSTSTSPRNNTSVSYFVVFICPISIPTVKSSSSSPPSSSQQLPLAFFPFHRPSTSSLRRMLGTIPDLTPLYINLMRYRRWHLLSVISCSPTWEIRYD